MDLAAAASRYIKAVEALHSVHSSGDVHGHGGIATAAITEHCAYICNATGDRVEVLDDGELSVIKGDNPHAAVLAEYWTAKELLESLI